MTEYNENDQVDIDAKFNDEVNAEQVDQIIKDGLPPQGTYQTDPTEYPLNAFLNVNLEKHGETIVGERRVITFTGLASGRFDGETITNRLRFRISPDARKKRDFETKELTEKDDLMTRLYAQAVKAYETTVGEKPKRNPDLIEWVKNAPIRVRTFNTDGGESMVIAISPVGRARRR